MFQPAMSINPPDKTVLKIAVETFETRSFSTLVLQMFVQIVLDFIFFLAVFVWTNETSELCGDFVQLNDIQRRILVDIVRMNLDIRNPGGFILAVAAFEPRRLVADVFQMNPQRVLIFEYFSAI